MTTKKFQPTPRMIELLHKAGSDDFAIASKAQNELAVALTLPLRQGVLSGDNLDGIFEVIQLPTGSTSEFPLDFVSPGSERDFIAYTIPNHGYIPQRHVEGDYVMIPTYDIGGSIDMNLKYIRDARWDVVGRAMEVLRQQFTKKLNDDGWHTVISAGVDRNILVYDDDATAEQFTKRLVALMKNVMRRNGGGNSTSTNRGMLTDLYMSPEGMTDMFNWNVDEVDELTRREIFINGDGLSRIAMVNLHDMDELGQGQEYQLFYNQDLAGTLPTGDVEIVVGLDLRGSDSFVMPMREDLSIFEDPTLHRSRRKGWYGWRNQGFGCLDGRRVLIGSY